MSLSFASAPKTEQQPEYGQIVLDTFFPVIDLNHMRQAMRIDNTITSVRLYEMALEAVIHVNRQLALTKQRALMAGQQTLVQADSKLPEIRYRHAVYNYTKANLSEIYADYDATGKTASRFESKQQSADDYRREAHAAIADILGIHRVDAELI